MASKVAAAVETILTGLESLNLEELKEVEKKCKVIIDDIENAEVNAIEEQMRILQEKLAILKPSTQRGKLLKKTVNPANPEEIYSGGPYPQWLKDLVAPANGDKAKEKEIIAALPKM